MILLFEENPKLVTYLDLEDEKKGQDRTFSKKTRALGSKGLLASQILSLGEISHKVLSPIGGDIGVTIKKFCKEEGLGLVDLEIKDSSQEVFVFRGKNPFKVQSKKPRLTQEEKNHLYRTLSAYQEEINTLVLFGGPEDLEEKYPYFLERGLNLRHKTFVQVDHKIQEIVAMRPYLFVCDKDQLEEYSGLKCNFAHEVKKASHGLMEAGVGAVYILGQAGVDMYRSKDQTYTINHKDLGPVSPGLVNLGLAMAHEKNYKLDLALKYGVALGLEKLEPGQVPDLAKLKETMKKIELKGEKL